jgi:hypothetical protein
MPEVVMHRGRQQIVLAPDRFFVGHERRLLRSLRSASVPPRWVARTFERGLRLRLVKVERSALCYPCFMAKQSPKPPAARLNGGGATGPPYGGRRFLTSA